MSFFISWKIIDSSYGGGGDQELENPWGWHATQSLTSDRHLLVTARTSTCLPLKALSSSSVNSEY